MPELPEVETVCRGLRSQLVGRILTRVQQRRPDLRFPFPPNFVARLEGRRVETVSRRAKYILVHLDGGLVLLCHLGMSGRMIISPMARNAYDLHDHVIFSLDSGHEVRFNDARRFGMMDLVEKSALAEHRLLRDLGMEPMSSGFDGPALADRLKGRASPIKAALLDQRVVAGIGNIYACEALFVAGISPRRRAYTVQGRRADRMALAIQDVLRRAIEAGGSSLRDYVQSDGELGYFQHQWAVYDRAGEVCSGCAQAGHLTPCIKRVTQSGRSTFYCKRSQR